MQVMEPPRPELSAIFDLLPSRCPLIFVAGGAAVDFDKAPDIDLWFSNNAEGAAREFLKSIKMPKSIRPEAEESDEDSSDIYDSEHFKVIGEFYFEYIGKMVQVLVTDRTSVKDCLNDFDISSHAKAITSTNEIVWAQDYYSKMFTSIIRVTPQTFSRYIKICKRYGHPMLQLDKYFK